MAVGYKTDKDALLKRLARIEGQVRGVSRMVEEERYCIDVLTQIGAIEAALDKVALGLIDDHTRHCVMRRRGRRADRESRRAGRRAGPLRRPLRR